MKKLSAPSSEELQWLSSPRSSSLQLCLVALRSDSPVGSIAERRSSWSAHLQSCPGKDHSTCVAQTGLPTTRLERTHQGPTLAPATCSMLPAGEGDVVYLTSLRMTSNRAKAAALTMAVTTVHSMISGHLTRAASRSRIHHCPSRVGCCCCIWRSGRRRRREHDLGRTCWLELAQQSSGMRSQVGMQAGSVEQDTHRRASWSS